MFMQNTSMQYSLTFYTSLNKTLQKIIDWARDLDLPQESVPNTTHQLLVLEELNFANCNLSDIPKEIVLLQNLKSLNLAGNALSEIPSVVFQLKNLEVLKVYCNSIKKIPDDILKLQNLQLFEATSNQITEVPDFSKMPKLTHLGLSYNKLVQNELPVTILPLTYEDLFEAQTLKNSIDPEMPYQIDMLLRASLEWNEYKTEYAQHNIKYMRFWIAKNTHNEIIALVGFYISANPQDINRCRAWVGLKKEYRGQGYGEELFFFVDLKKIFFS